MLAGASLVSLDALISGCRSIYSQPHHSSTQINPIGISFEEALADKDNKRGVRQKYLEQLVKSPYVKVIYDHDGSLSKKAALEDTEIILRTPELFDYYSKIYFMAKVEQEREKLETPKEQDKFKEYLINLLSGIADRIAPRFLENEIGRKPFTEIYVVKSIFEKHELGRWRRDAYLEPSEEIIKAIFEHESVHAADIANGINLGNGLYINSANSLVIDPKVLNFVMESRAYLHEIQYAKTHLGNDAYIFALSLFLNYFYYSSTIVDSPDLRPYEKAMIDTQMSKIEKLQPEIDRLFK